jgi:hypothetical protein
MKTLPFLPLAAIFALGACTQTMPAGSTPVATAQPVVAVPVAPVTSTQTVTTSFPVSGTQYVVVSPAGAVQPVVQSTVVETTTTTLAVPGRLTATEIFRLMADNTAEGRAGNGELYGSLFRHDGQLMYRQGEYRDRGSWRVSNDGRLCSALTRINSGAEDCYSLYREGANYRFERPDGNKIGTFTVVSGNTWSL